MSDAADSSGGAQEPPGVHGDGESTPGHADGPLAGLDASEPTGLGVATVALFAVIGLGLGVVGLSTLLLLDAVWAQEGGAIVQRITELAFSIIALQVVVTALMIAVGLSAAVGLSTARAADARSSVLATAGGSFVGTLLLGLAVALGTVLGRAETTAPDLGDVFLFAVLLAVLSSVIAALCGAIGVVAGRFLAPEIEHVGLSSL